MNLVLTLIIRPAVKERRRKNILEDVEGQYDANQDFIYHSVEIQSSDLQRDSRLPRFSFDLSRGYRGKTDHQA